MGQAKQRGTYEQRQAQGIQRKAEEHKRRVEQRENERVVRMQRDVGEVAKQQPVRQRKSRQMLLASAATIAIASSLSHGDTDIQRVWENNAPPNRGSR
jgi:gamma-glutamyl:cysteine ligase YbdK (ATP-grasp superfamily)